MHIAGYAHESGRSIVIVVNKWDLSKHTLQTRQPAPRSCRRSRSGAAI